MIIFVEDFCGNEEHSVRELKSMREHLHGNGDEDDHVAPEDGLLGVVVDVDCGSAVDGQARNARRGFAFV